MSDSVEVKEVTMEAVSGGTDTKFFAFRELGSLQDVLFVLNSASLAMEDNNPRFSQAVKEGYLVGVSSVD